MIDAAAASELCVICAGPQREGHSAQNPLIHSSRNNAIACCFFKKLTDRAARGCRANIACIADNGRRNYVKMQRRHPRVIQAL